MTPEEAIKVLKVLYTADGGCRYCAEALIEKFNLVFPEHATSYDKAAQDMALDEVEKEEDAKWEKEMAELRGEEEVDIDAIGGE